MPPQSGLVGLFNRCRWRFCSALITHDARELVEIALADIEHEVVVLHVGPRVRDVVFVDEVFDNKDMLASRLGFVEQLS